MINFKTPCEVLNILKWPYASFCYVIVYTSYMHEVYKLYKSLFLAHPVFILGDGISAITCLERLASKLRNVRRAGLYHLLTYLLTYLTYLLTYSAIFHSNLPLHRKKIVLKLTLAFPWVHLVCWGCTYKFSL